MTVLLVVSNLAIALGYGYVAFVLVPLLPVRRVTTVSGLAFFTLCALTHVDMAIHVMVFGRETYAEAAREWHMLAIHVPQAVAIWIFASCFVQDMLKLEQERDTTRVALSD